MALRAAYRPPAPEAIASPWPDPYFFKVDTAGNQLPYIDRHHERFLDQELFILSILNGEVDQKAQTVGLSNYPVLKENEAKGGYHLQLPPGNTGPPMPPATSTWSGTFPSSPT